ncbi:arylsulfatase [Formosa agariphila KMM 3901]|uniref:Arylsulfatase n=1 Tax=Formosa agariphila (strain DSM 15362 / KCTC 12365 / LMG 23005 / KMM 3901 / M-2Alg 35-1) TaxID=1347342 RepID=T2KQ03_FORAG|nr:sulfatase-like hydrolase/transferase [Formosa agariphila]CDF80800.1 arylsulfatase [Formosa agariphila KMM 3901]
MFNAKVAILLSSFIIFMVGCKQDIVKEIKSTEVQPNVIIILTDDQAYGDLSFTGNPYVNTPVIDKLAATGAIADQFYVSPVCAPTRASLLTGRYHQRTGVSGVTRGRENMNLDEVTFGDVFQSLGYRTGIFGKWHNGAHFPYHPLGRGFDTFVGFTSGHWTNYYNTTIEKNGKDFKTSGYLTDVLTDEAISFIKESNTEKKPFLCYIPYQTPHTPLQVPDSYFNKFNRIGLGAFNSAIYGMAENIDDNIGRLVTVLEDLNIKDNTIIVYMSDNGPLNFRYNAGLKGKKGSVNEGGVKVPFLINWKNKIEAHKQISIPLAHIDVLPTILDLINKNYDFEKQIDGISFKSQIESKNEIQLPSRKLYQEWNGNKRVRSGDYLLVNEELFNVKLDSSQSQDVRSDRKGVFDSLSFAFSTWENTLPKETKQKYIPVGFCEFPQTYLPAHEANLYPPFEFRKDRKKTGIAYHSLYGWAHDWIDYWTSTAAYPSWEIDVQESGNYKIYLEYALALKDEGVRLRLRIDSTTVAINNLKAFEHTELKNYDRVKRDQEAPETNWKTHFVAEINLLQGQQELRIETETITGEKSIELKGIKIIKVGCLDY